MFRMHSQLPGPLGSVPSHLEVDSIRGEVAGNPSQTQPVNSSAWVDGVYTDEVRDCKASYGVT
jgi:hypothetical protein